jgi:hypothetical protein
MSERAGGADERPRGRRVSAAQVEPAAARRPRFAGRVAGDTIAVVAARSGAW